ncbi:LOW QUALITY PROTEIN: hypothetical protein QYF61_000613 [Mycteria americana]|uniref:C2H2-type domain-containing protein n=1 Tax=Mycteria americana TaxID=33587 RepID=A0AAN7N8E7_MYCAM|nr:LOW QUALITY PROTEIN: hypothetical protein QYF61_000613 [Mycteria americana]
MSSWPSSSSSGLVAGRTKEEEDSQSPELGERQLGNHHEMMQTSFSHGQGTFEDLDAAPPSEEDVLNAENIFSWRYSLIHHHTGESFGDGSNLISHQRIHHGKKPFFCGKSFGQRVDLISHRSILGEKSYVCPSCGKCFVQRSHLTTHQMTLGGERPYMGQDRRKSFGRSSSLIRHQWIHMPELCEGRHRELKAHGTPVDPHGRGYLQVLHVPEDLQGAEVPPEPPRGVEGGGDSPCMGEPTLAPSAGEASAMVPTSCPTRGSIMVRDRIDAPVVARASP